MQEVPFTVTIEPGSMPVRLMLPRTPQYPSLVVFYMDIFGIREELVEMCRRLCRAGYAVALPSLFHRHGNPTVDPLAWYATEGALIDRDDPLHPMRLNRETTNSMVTADTGALLAHLDNHPHVDARRVGTVGTCMGGRHAMLAAAHYPGRVRAFASLHGGRMLTDEPDSPHLAIPLLQAEGYFGWAENDGSAPEEHLEEYRRLLTEHGVPHRIDYMEGARHGYSFPTRTDHYNHDAAERSWNAILNLFARQLQGEKSR